VEADGDASSDDGSDDSLAAAFAPGDSMRVVRLSDESRAALDHARRPELAHLPPLCRISHALAALLRPGDRVVDLACGENKWISQVEGVCRLAGLPVTFRAYDITCPEPGFREHYAAADWRTLPPCELGSADRLTLGLAPEWGSAGKKTAEFLERAASLRPRLLALVLPAGAELPTEYLLVQRTAGLFKDKASRPRLLPGTMVNAPLLFFLMVRRDACTARTRDDGGGRTVTYWDLAPPQPLAAAAVAAAKEEEQAERDPEPTASQETEPPMELPAGAAADMEVEPEAVPEPPAADEPEAAPEAPVEAALEAPAVAAPEAPVEAAPEAPAVAAPEAPVEAALEAPPPTVALEEATEAAPPDAVANGGGDSDSDDSGDLFTIKPRTSALVPPAEEAKVGN
jgi:hypothetical protein